MVVRGPDAVAFGVGELSLDHVRPEAVLVEDGAGRAAEAVAGGAGVVPHAIERVEHGVLAHGLEGVVLVGEDVLAVAGEFP